MAPVREKEKKGPSASEDDNKKTNCRLNYFPDPQRCTDCNFRAAKGINTVNEAGYRKTPL